jgi:hypothetical protein
MVAVLFLDLVLLVKTEMKNIQTKSFRRVPRSGWITFLVTLVVVSAAVFYFRRLPTSGQGMSPPWELSPKGEWRSFTTNYPSGYDTRGFDFLSRFEVMRVFDQQGKRQSHREGATEYTFFWNGSALEISKRNQQGVSLDIVALLHRLNGGQASQRPVTLDQAELTVDAEGHGVRVRVYIEDISALKNEKGAWDVYHLRADILVGARE